MSTSASRFRALSCLFFIVSILWMICGIVMWNQTNYIETRSNSSDPISLRIQIYNSLGFIITIAIVCISTYASYYEFKEERSFASLTFLAICYLVYVLINGALNVVVFYIFSRTEVLCQTYTVNRTPACIDVTSIWPGDRVPLCGYDAEEFCEALLPSFTYTLYAATTLLVFVLIVTEIYLYVACFMFVKNRTAKDNATDNIVPSKYKHFAHRDSGFEEEDELYFNCSDSKKPILA